jgi:flavin reductase
MTIHLKNSKALPRLSGGLTGAVMEAIGKDEFRSAMAGLGAAVNIITTDGPFGRAGFTASAVCSVTDTPPTLLVCVNRATSVHGFVSKNRLLCVNTLSAKDKSLSPLFGAKVSMIDRFAATTWSTLVTGSPVLRTALVSFDCRIVDVRSVGTHDVFFCEVVAIARNDEEEAALLYYNRQYHEVGRVVKLPGFDVDLIEWQ